MTIETVAAFDVMVVGGSYAGLSAALQLARARRRVLVIDAGMQRNRFSTVSYAFLGQDGREPDAIVRDGRDQLLKYREAHWRNAVVTTAEKSPDGSFLARTAAGDCYRAQRLIIATGVIDELPMIDGLRERWGRSVVRCPYCHGYELNRGRIGVIGVGQASIEQALLLPDWGDVTMFINAFELDARQRATLEARGVTLESGRVSRVVDTATVELEEGRLVQCDALFVAAKLRMASPIAEQLGCVISDGSAGVTILTDATKRTSIPGVFACGDAANLAGSIALAVGDGALAGFGAHRSLVL